MKKIFLLLLAPLVLFSTLSAQITQKEADDIVKTRLDGETKPYTVYAKKEMQSERFTVITSAGEVLELGYSCWVYYVNYAGEVNGKYLIVKENNGNLLEVNTKKDGGPNDLAEWREIVILQGITWKLIAFVDTETGEIKEVEPKNYERCYHLTFHKGDTLQGVAFNHLFYGNYTFDEETSNIQIFKEQIPSMHMERFDGVQYLNSLDEIQSFFIQKNELKLYYNNKKNYLLFKSILPPNEPNVLANTFWKLTGYVDVQTGEMQIPEEMTEISFRLGFVNNYILWGYSATNTLTGRYIFEETTSNIYIVIQTATAVGEPFEGKQYIATLNEVRLQLFLLQENELMLYYNNETNYLLFKKQ
jgi:hypothetical protein